MRAEKDWGPRLLRILRRGLLHKWRQGRGGAEEGRVRRMAWRWRVRDWRGGESDGGEREADGEMMERDRAWGGYGRKQWEDGGKNAESPEGC